MATGVLADSGCKAMLQDIIAAANVAGMVAHLYTGNIVPANTDVLGTYTPSEATFVGYAAQAITAWSGVGVAAHVASSSANEVTFTITAGAQNVFGVFFTDPGGTVLFGAVRDPAAPVALNVAGTNNYAVDTTLTLQSM
jgi:hypothetical protein